MPTGIALRDARAQLFAAAERVLARAGVSGLTSRAVTEEAGVAKGVLHRHFADFDDFLAELIRDRVTLLTQETSRLEKLVGTADVVSNLATALTHIFTPTALGLIAVISSRDGVRAQLRETTPHGVPIFTEATAMLSTYLRAERGIGRLIPQADTDALAFTLIGTGHLLFAGELGGLPDTDAVEEIVASIVVGAEPGVRP
ncbi:TetR/AcrR family transcriptional regulator [Nocardia jinanensis]|uniref:TetR family transcriptional regulator n=1 Tax=Nocardia jinanensis TaxID=382504 RepID=A0A917VL35_9NOCA|nr:TetR/AcrR family transcriptional regulator [Nocardia jinanensis]GGK91797.1 TetR family transcriptional regulator [Nocardia jinanensis]